MKIIDMSIEGAKRNKEIIKLWNESGFLDGLKSRYKSDIDMYESLSKQELTSSDGILPVVKKALESIKEQEDIIKNKKGKI